MGEQRFKFNITFEYNNKIYKISKKVKLYLYTPDYVGRIVATFLSPETGDVWKDGTVRLDRVHEKAGEINFIGNVETGIDGKITYYNVPIGTYRLTKMIDGKEIESRTVEVKTGEISTIEF